MQIVDLRKTEHRYYTVTYKQWKPVGNSFGLSQEAQFGIVATSEYEASEVVKSFFKERIEIVGIAHTGFVHGSLKL